MARVRIGPPEVVRVAPADDRDALAAAQPLLPEDKRRRVELQPVGVPRLHGMEGGDAFVLPRRSEGLGMADAHDRAGVRRGAHRALDRRRVRLAELPPAIGPPGVPVTAVGRDLDPGHDDRELPAAGTVLQLVRDVVVVGHAEEIEARLGRGVEQGLRPRIAVRIDGVTVEVAAEPSLARLRKRLRIDEPRDADGPPGRADARIEPDLDAPVAAAWTDLVGTEEHVPPAGADLPFAVGRRRPRLVDRELQLVAAAPAPEPGAAVRDPALVEEPDVESVAAGDRRVRVDPIVVGAADVELAEARRDVERDVGVAPLVVGGEGSLEEHRRGTELALGRQRRLSSPSASRMRTYPTTDSR